MTRRPGEEWDGAGFIGLYVLGHLPADAGWEQPAGSTRLCAHLKDLKRLRGGGAGWGRRRRGLEGFSEQGMALGVKGDEVGARLETGTEIQD